MGMKQLIALLGVAAFGLYLQGCANTQQEQTIKDMGLRLVVLEKARAKTDVNLDEMNNKFLLLKEQVDINRKGMEELRAASVPVNPPEELKVVKLKTEEIKTEHKKEETREIKRSYSPEELYNEAQNLFMAGRFPESVDLFSKFILNYPRHTLADNALYWIGEVYYSQKNYQKALLEFKAAADNYPNENKAPDALLKVGFSHIELGNRESGIEALKTVIEKYPSSEAAVKAKLKLNEMQK